MSSHVLLTTSQAAQAVGLSSSALCRLEALGAPCSYTPGGHRRWDVDELREYLWQRAHECEQDCEDEDGPDDEDELDDEDEPEECPHCGGDLTPDADDEDEEDDDATENPDDDDLDDD